MFFQTSAHVLQAVLQAGSFTKAAQKLDMSSAAAGKHIQALERKLNLRLFHRTTRTVTPTEAAIKLSAAISQSQNYLDDIVEGLADEHNLPTGRLRINVPMSYGELFLAKPMARFASLYPDVIVDVDFDDKRVHLIEDGYDLVVRIGILEDSGLIARRISDFPLYLCASPELIKKYGQPAHPEDISDWPFICYTNAMTPSVWSYKDKAGIASSLSLSPALYANSASMMKEACLAGVGAALLPEFCCHAEIAAGALVPILSDYPSAPERGVYVVYPEKNFVPLKVRKFIECLQENMNR